MKQINETLQRPLDRLSSTSIENGIICAAPFQIHSSKTTPAPPINMSSPLLIERTQYYRAKILHRIDNVMVEIFFLDWGNTEQVPIDQCLYLTFLLTNERKIFF